MTTPLLLSDWMLALASVGAGVVFAAGAYAVRALSPSGAVAGGALAACLVGIGGAVWMAPALTFFVLSSALSKMPHDARPRAGAGEAGSARTAVQVFANGGVAWGLMLVWGHLPEMGTEVHRVLYVAGCGAFAAAAADTWATEVGTRVATPPRSIVTGAPVPVGTSGGVSLGGTLGGVLGAASVGGAVGAVGATEAMVRLGLIVTAAGVAGMLADSLAGATVQAQYIDPIADRPVDRPPTPGAVPARGWRGLTNDAINIIGTLAGATGAASLWLLLG